MRRLWMPLLTSLFISAPAYADCIGPYECFCTFTSSTTQIVVARVEARRDERTTLAVESVFGAEGPVASGDQLSATLYGAIEAGDRLLVNVRDGDVDRFGVVVEQDDGTVECSGFRGTDLTVSDLVEARGAEDCYEDLRARNPTFESPPCNDVITGPFGCSSTAPADARAWLLGLGLLVWRRRRALAARRGGPLA